VARRDTEPNSNLRTRKTASKHANVTNVLVLKLEPVRIVGYAVFRILTCSTDPKITHRIVRGITIDVANLLIVGQLAPSGGGGYEPVEAMRFAADRELRVVPRARTTPAWSKLSTSRIISDPACKQADRISGQTRNQLELFLDGHVNTMGKLL